MKVRISEFVTFSALSCTICLAPFPAHSFNDDMYVCATVTEIFETESEDCMYFSAKGNFLAEGAKEKELAICLDDDNDAANDSTLAVESLEQQIQVFIVFDGSSVRRIQRTCP